VATGARLVTAGTVGKPHGLDGTFTVDRPDHPLAKGTVVELDGAERRVEHRGGTDRRPLIRLSGISSREAVKELRAQLLLVEDTLAEGEWLAADLIGCAVGGLGKVVRVIDAPSCDLLELDGGELVPLISDAIERVDLDARTIEIDMRFLRLDGDAR
jgi:16S rRNA processing protein RimM